LVGYCSRKGYSIYFLGSEQYVVEKAVKRLSEQYPDLKVHGYHHGFFQKHGSESDNVVENINTCQPNVLLVGFGMPLQEDWIRRNFERLNVNVVLTAGSSFEYAAGKKPVCPPWVSRIGLEWFYRFLFEPRRLFKRYFFGNPKYLTRVLLQRLRNGVR
jgi:N-acetylglucosaminyldiphosphoundecaprenol N-acetyl-beta-D-mannosaminyltransferase